MSYTPSNSKKNNLLSKKNIFIAIVVLFITLTGASMVALANSNKVTVEVPTLNVRYGPGLSHDVVTQVHESEQLNILDEQNQWYKVRLSNDEIGWVASWLVEEQEVTTETQQFGRITNSSVNIREFGTAESDILGTASMGTELQILFEENDWTQVLYGDQVGWVYSSYIEPVESNAQTSTIESDQQVHIGDTDVNIRTQPAVESNIYSTAPAGSNYPYLGSENGWYEIQIDETTTGYVSSSYAEVSTNTEATIQEPESSPVPSTTNISEATVVIDAGHGGEDPGAVTGDYYEKDATLSTAYILQRRLENAGANVIMSRTDDTFISLDQRVVTSANAGADAFISLHYDSSDTPGSNSGTTTYYYSNADEALAQTVNSYLDAYGPLGNNGYRQGNYYVLRNNSRPSLLVELGFMNNANDLAYIQSPEYQATIADAIFGGLNDYFSN